MYAYHQFKYNDNCISLLKIISLLFLLPIVYKSLFNIIISSVTTTTKKKCYL